jgi:hypothetical protein
VKAAMADRVLGTCNFACCIYVRIFRVKILVGSRGSIV